MKEIIWALEHQSDTAARAPDNRPPPALLDLCERLARSGLFERDARHMLLAVARMPAVPNCDFGACGLAGRVNTRLSELANPRIAISEANGGNQPFLDPVFPSKIKGLRKSQFGIPRKTLELEVPVMLLKLDPHLTANSATDKARFTHQGQAHFGGTGPKGKTCRECIHWCTFPGLMPAYYGRQRGFEVKGQACREFGRLMQREGPAVPHDAPSCKHFQLSDDPPPQFDKWRR